MLGVWVMTLSMYAGRVGHDLVDVCLSNHSMPGVWVMTLSMYAGRVGHDLVDVCWACGS